MNRESIEDGLIILRVVAMSTPEGNQRKVLFNLLAWIMTAASEDSDERLDSIVLIVEVIRDGLVGANCTTARDRADALTLAINLFRTE